MNDIFAEMISNQLKLNEKQMIMICDFNLALSITGILKNNFDTNFIGLFINYPFPNL